MSQNLFTSIGMIACLMGTGVLWHLLRKLRAQEKEMATLRASEELMRFMMEADQTGYWELPLADHTMRRSLTHDRIFGYASLLPTWTCTDFLNHIFVDDREAAKRTFQKAIEAKHDCYFQCRIVRRDGMMRWIEVRSRRLNGEAGTLDRVIGLVRDITAYKEAEKLVSQTEQFKAAVLDAIPAEIAVLDQAGKILAVNQPWLQFGYENQSHPERTAGVGINYLDVARDSACSGDVLAGEAVEGIEAVLSGRQREFHLEYPCDAPAQQRWFLMHVVAAPTEMGGAIVTHSDITARKQAQEALSKSQKVLELAIEGGQFGIWDWDLMTDKLLWSERRKAIAGLPPETETTPALFLSTIHPEDRAHVQRAVEHALKTKKASEMEFRTVWPDGTTRWVQSRGRIFEDASGRLVRFTGITLDVTERRESEEALRRFNAELERLVQERTEVIQVAMQELRAEVAERRRLEEQILGVDDRAQARIGQELHDDLGQQLVGIAMLSQLLSNQLNAESHPKAPDADRLKSCLVDSINTTRNLAKSFYPVELERGGLILALHNLAHRTEMLAKVCCTVKVEEGFHIEKPSEIHLYRIVQESIANAIKHGNAKTIVIECVMSSGIRLLTILNDGSRFRPPEEGKWSGMGLHIFQYRARLIGAEIMVGDGENNGCKVTCAIPAHKPPPGGLH